MKLTRGALTRFRLGYVQLDGTKEQYTWWAGDHTPFRHRRMRATLKFDTIDTELADCVVWADTRHRIFDDDRRCEIKINANWTSMRCGYVVLRRGKPIRVVVPVVN